MEQNLILAGVGGQGILTIAQAISKAALRRGLHIKQAEVHGMSQRGGGVQSHLRIASHEIFSDLIQVGHVDLIIAVEPLESLRYVHYLAEQGALVSSLNAFVNIGNYPPIETVLDRVSAHRRHILIDGELIARAAGSGRASNMAVLGAASLHLALDPQDLEDAVSALFEDKGENVVEGNQRAFRFGRNAAMAYLDGLERGATSRTVRHWHETLPTEHLAEPERPDMPVIDVVHMQDKLSGAEVHAVERALRNVYEEGRTQLFEHEVYTIVQLIGAISPPHHIFLSMDELISEDALAQFPGERVVVKLVSPDVVHKSDANGIVFVRKDYDSVREEIDRLIERHRETADVRGVLVVEFVERTQPGFGNELFLGIRATREFGPVIAAGLGGIDTEYLARKMLPGIAVAKALATDTTAEEFLELFKKTAAYDILSGRARGRRREVSDGELLRCFRAFILLAQRFCVARGEGGPDVAELEVNPFAFRQQRMIPLDGRGTLFPVALGTPARPVAAVEALLEPRSIGVLGASATAMNFGRIILNNVLDSGFPRERLYAVKAGQETLDGARCIATLSEAPEPLDLLVIAAAAKQLPALVREAWAADVGAVILISGGVGETEGSEDIKEEVRAAIAEGRREGRRTVFLGPNSLGVISRPGHYDTFFIPSGKLDKRWAKPARRAALLSQSGAFIVSRLSNLETLDPAFAVSIGNQLDLTPSDVMMAIGRRDDIDVIGLYAEGFNDLDGLVSIQTIRTLSEAGKDIVFYKAGRTEQGRSAAAGHTAAVAGDYDVCQSAAGQAGAIVTDTFKEFEQLMELCTALHCKDVAGVHVGAISNAGFETVGMADAIRGHRYKVDMVELSGVPTARLAQLLTQQGLGALVNPRNPLDLTPMANEDAYEGAIRVMLDSPEIHALVVGVVPLTAALETTPDEIGETGSLVERLPRLFHQSKKPIIVVVDSGSLYDPLARAIRSRGVPVFRSADQAIRSLGRYLCHRVYDVERFEGSESLGAPRG